MTLLKTSNTARRSEKALKVVAGTILLTLVLLNVEFNLLEANLYDLRMSRGFQPQADSNIVLVTVDDTTAHELDAILPLTLDHHAQLLERIAELKPRAVGYLVNLTQVNQADPDYFSSEWGTRFVAAAKKLESQGTPVLLGTPYDVTGEVIPPYPLSSLPHAVALIHKDGNVFAEDKVTRRALLELNGHTLFHLEMARRAGHPKTAPMPRGSYEVPEVDGTYFFFRYHGSTALESPHDPRDKSAASGVRGAAHPLRGLAYPTISFVDLLKGRVAPGALEGKVVLVGTVSREDYSDFAATPYSRAPFTNPKLAVHANILDSILHNDGIVRMPAWLNGGVTFIAAMVVLWSVLTSTPLYGVFLTLGLSIVFMLLSQLGFQFLGIWIRESQPLIGIFTGYYLAVPYRLIQEYKKRWAFQRQNELLTQVEELKTNFLQLVTHDLKTPVARIQGLAEVLLRRADAESRDNLRHIIGSTEELNRFISSILELSKVESQEIQMRFESKDVNQLIERLVEGCLPHARARQITIETNLEPLFPIRIDATLITKVLSNLIDNAIKYSAPESRIVIESREIGSRVEITIRDQGIGMSPDEVESLFTKFYRAKNAATTGIPGTGLGLYLTKYFIEAHEGRVEVESERGKGSTFKVSLPIQASGLVSGSPVAGSRSKSRWSQVIPGLTRLVGEKARKSAGKGAALKENEHV